MPTAELEATTLESTAGVEPPRLEPAARAPEPTVARTIEPSSIAREAAPRPTPKPSPVASEPTAAPRPEPAARAQPATPAPREVTTGTLLGGRFLLGRLLGAGGSSLIFQAEDRRRIGAEDFGSSLAIKVLRPEARKNAHALTRLRREFRQMRRLSHPGIAKVYELACDEDIWFMTMELIEGQTINQWMKTSANRAEGLKLIGACCEALHHAHKAGVVHGDLKPSNVLVLANGRVKLVDFGSAAERDASMDVIDTERSYAATPPYASPQVLAGEVADPRDDVFSLACLTYAVLTQGQHPFERKSSAEAQQAQMRPAYAPGILPRQFEVIARALSWDRAQRPASVREFMHALLASDLRREPPAREAAAPEIAGGPTKPTTEVKPEDVARLKAAAAEAQAKSTGPAPAKEPRERARADPLERFKGYVVGPLASQRENVGQSATRPTPENPTSPLKKKWTWPWQRSTLFGVLLVAAAAIIASRIELETEPIRTTEAEASPALPVAYAAPPVEPPANVESQPVPIAKKVEEKKSPPVAVKPKAAATAPGEVSFTTRTLQIAANQTVAALAVKRVSSTRGRARVAWTIEGGTARAGVHYEIASPQVIEFLDGQSVRSLFIPLKPDKDAEGMRHSKTFTVKLQQTNGGPALGEIKQVHVTIVGDVADDFAATTAQAGE